MANDISKFEKESLCKKTDLVNNNKPLTGYYGSRLKHHTHDSIVSHNSFKVLFSKADSKSDRQHHGTTSHDFRNSYFNLVNLSCTF